MAELDASGETGSFGFLTKKLGPFPVWVWALAAVAGYYWYTHYGPGAQTTTAATTTTASTDTGSGVGGSKFSTNAQWEVAAINFLDGESVPPDEASAAVWKYLHSQALTAQEQKDVNLAIDGIGPPPNVPAPAPVVKGKPKPKPKPLAVGSRPTGGKSPVSPKPGPKPPVKRTTR